DQLRVAVAWGDGRFRLWDAERPGAKPAEAPDYGNNNAVVLLPGATRALTCSYDLPKTGAGRLQLWDVSGQQPTPVKNQDLPRAGDVFHVPRALALLPSRPGGDLDRVAVAVVRMRVQEGTVIRSTFLQLHPVGPNRIDASTVQVPLWDDSSLT